ncbi:hypothetical protein ABZ297_18520 [Nonomuraea sp. NPDC005983]|uniref:hypothetical protein n=1 Tax=Nonomuraea sp. NPDC005983 TaxID=3155595 RepID=UPI0033A68028
MGAVQAGRAGEEEAHLGQADRAPAALELLDGLLGGVPGLRDQADRQQQLAAVGEEPAELVRAQRAEALLGAVEVGERGRDVAPHGAHPAQVHPDDGERQVQVERGAELLRLAQVGLGGGELVAVAVHDAPVRQHPLQPQVVPGPAQGGDGDPVSGERVVAASEMVEDGGALGLGARPRDAVQGGQRAVDLRQRLLRLAAQADDERQPDPRLGGQFR